MNFVKFLRIPFFTEHLRWLLLILHCPKELLLLFSRFCPTVTLSINSSYSYEHLSSILHGVLDGITDKHSIRI